VLRPLFDLERADLSGPARGVAFQLGEGMGTVARGPALAAAGALSRADRAGLRECGVRIGSATLYVPGVLKPAAVRLRAVLWAVWSGAPFRAAPAPGLTTVKAERDVPHAFYDSIGYPVIAGRAVRADMLERLDGLLRHAARRHAEVPTAQIMSLAGLGAEDAAQLIAGLRKRPARRAKPKPAPAGNAFAKLRELGLS
jgi:ATP-dependent RNA helicase SUPV3L1/SUV3